MKHNKLKDVPEKSTNPLIWCGAIICTIIAIAVIITGIAVFIGYMVLHPSVPVISVLSAHIDHFSNDQAGLLETQLTIDIKAENDNAKAHASFSNTQFVLSFQGIPIARLVVGHFDVAKNDSVVFHYEVASSSIPLNSDEMEKVNLALKQDLIVFDLKGNSRARWRVGIFKTVKFYCHLNCQLKFHPLNGSYMHSRCTSRVK